MKTSIFGAAGTVGSTTAYTLACRDLVDEIVLIDSRHSFLMNHAMDINTAAKSCGNTLVRPGEIPDIESSDIVIVTAGIHPATIDLNLPTVREIGGYIARYCPDTIVITATNPVDALNYGMLLTSHLPREKVIGYSYNDTIRFRIAVAEVMEVPISLVQGLVLGIHPDKQVMLFSTVKMQGKPVMVDDKARDRIRIMADNYLKELRNFHAGRTAGWTTAAGLVSVVESIVSDSGTVMPNSVVADGEYGFSNLSLGLPAALGRNGVSKVVTLDLSADEKQQLEYAGQLMKAECDTVRDYLNQS